MPPTTATPTLLQDPGFLFWAPLLTAVPTMTAAASVFDTEWPGAWINLGATVEGSVFSSETTIEPTFVAELFDPVTNKTTERVSAFAFALANYTMTNLKKVLNGGTLTVTGSAGTTVTKYTPVTPGSEVRCMIGWESLDRTVRLVCYQTIQGGSVEMNFAKAPEFTALPATFNLEAPTTGVPYEFWSAGVPRG